MIWGKLNSSLRVDLCHLFLHWRLFILGHWNSATVHVMKGKSFHMLSSSWYWTWASRFTILYFREAPLDSFCQRQISLWSPTIRCFNVNFNENISVLKLGRSNECCGSGYGSTWDQLLNQLLAKREFNVDSIHRLNFDCIFPNQFQWLF